MRKFISALTLGILVIAWEFLLQFGTVQLVLTTLRSKGSTGALMADFLSSQGVVLAIALVAIGLGITGWRELRKQRRPQAMINSERPQGESVTQIMTSSPGGMQAGRDIRTTPKANDDER